MSNIRTAQEKLYVQNGLVIKAAKNSGFPKWG